MPSRKVLMELLYLFPLAVMIGRFRERFPFAQRNVLGIRDVHMERIFADLHVLSVIRRPLARFELRLLTHVRHLLRPG